MHFELLSKQALNGVNSLVEEKKKTTDEYLIELVSGLQLTCGLQPRKNENTCSNLRKRSHPGNFESGLNRR